MNKLFININHIKIAYYDVSPQKKDIIFFIHGNSGSADTWKKQLTDNRFNNYRLIAIDLPAHGNSDSLENGLENYNCITLAKIISDFIKRLANENNYLLAGFSLGANIVAELLAHSIFPQGIVLSGASVIGGAYTMQIVFKETEDGDAFFTDKVSELKLAGAIDTILMSKNESDIQPMKDDYNNVKLPFRSSILKNTLQGKISDEIMLLQKVQKPILIIFGKEEKLINADYLDAAPLKLWNNEVHKIPEAGHAVNIDQPEIYNELLLTYCNEVF